MTSIPYEELAPESPRLRLPPALAKAHGVLKALAQCQVMAGLVLAALGGLGFVNGGTLRVLGLGLWAGLYTMVAGLVGVCGAGSFRRGLVTSFLVMSLHVIFFVVPALLLAGAFGVFVDGNGCYVQCHTQPGLYCQLLCEGDADWSWTPNYAGRAVDFGLVAVAVIQLILSLFCCVFCSKAVCESCGVLDYDSMLMVVKETALARDLTSRT